MKRLLNIMAGLVLLLSSQSCILSLVHEVTHPRYHVAWEPYTRFSVTIDGETTEYTDKSGGSIDLPNHMGFSKNNGDPGIRFDASIHHPFEMYISIMDSREMFKTETTYWPRQLNMINRYGHLCTMKDGNIHFHRYKKKAYDLFELTFDCTLVDPDTGYLIFIRDGQLTVCKNSMSSLNENIEDYLSL